MSLDIEAIKREDPHGYIMLLEQKLEFYKQCVQMLAGELVVAGMAEYTPQHNEMIQLGKWGLGLIELIEKDE